MDLTERDGLHIWHPYTQHKTSISKKRSQVIHLSGKKRIPDPYRRNYTAVDAIKYYFSSTPSTN